MKNKSWLIFLSRNIEDSIYMKALELGYENDTNGISFNEVVSELKIDLSNELFEVNFAHWFYTNFYNENFEYSILAQQNSTTDMYYFNKHNYESSKEHNNEKSFIRGDSLNKYIDYLELKRTRKSSRNATLISLLSMLIALASIVISGIYPKDAKPFHDVNNSYEWNKGCQHELNDSSNREYRAKDMYNSKTKTSTKLDSVN